MAHKAFDLAQQLTTSTGTGALTLGAVPSGMLSFADGGATTGDTFWGCIRHTTANEVEVTLCTYVGDGTITRASVPLSSTTGSKINFSAGTKTISCVAPASKLGPVENGSGQYVFPGVIGIPDGSVSVPGAFFSSDTDTGIYRPAANTVGISAGGVLAASITAALAIFAGSVGIGNGTVSTPGLLFSGDTDTGIYRPAADTLGIAAGGVAVASLSSSKVTVGAVSTTLSTGYTAIGPTKVATAPLYWIDIQEKYVDAVPGGAGAHVAHMFAQASLSSLNDFGQITGWYGHLDADASVTSGKTVSSLYSIRGNSTWTPPGTVNQMAGGYFGGRLIGEGPGNYVYGVRAEAAVEDTATADAVMTNGYGIEAQVRNYGPAAIGTATGVYSYVNNYTSGGGINYAFLFRGEVNSQGAGIGSVYGLYLGESITDETNWWAIYSLSAAKSRIAGKLAIGSVASSATAQLLVTGTTHLNGSTIVGSATTAATNLTITANIMGATTAQGVWSRGVIQSDVTTTARYFTTQAETAASSFTLGSIIHYRAAQGTFGAGSSVTSQYGILIESSLIGATNNYGVYSNIPAASGRWNFYGGTANNAFAGNSRFGGTSAPTEAVHVTGSADVSGVYKVGGTQVVGARDTGWTAMTGTANENTSYDTGSVTLPQLAGRVMALQAALTTHGLIGA